MLSFELCAGAGGLALATSQAGFRPVAMLESDPIACDTINANRGRQCEWAKSWPTVTPTDVRKFDYSTFRTPIDLLSGGPPCQPFSSGGKQLGINDDRDLFGEVARAICHLSPRAILIENTKGLTSKPFQKQLRYICLQLAHPGIRRKPHEAWEAFLDRLEHKAITNPFDGVHYSINSVVHNAADYGVPQQRERLIIAGFRSPAIIPFIFPSPTHSLDALLYQQWVTTEYWDRHKIASRYRPSPPDKWRPRIQRLGISKPTITTLPWVTVRDALATLPEPSGPDCKCKMSNHRLQLGARVYPRHTGSRLDLPAKALKAGRHGVPGGENMMVFPSGAVRYFTIRECARLQTFPDDYYFSGPWSATTRQLGNAVPVALCRITAAAIRARLEMADIPKKAVAMSK